MGARNWGTNPITIYVPLFHSTIPGCRQEELRIYRGEGDSCNSIIVCLYDKTLPCPNVPQTNCSSLDPEAIIVLVTEMETERIVSVWP